MTANDVIQGVRRRLGDTREERWRDEVLLLYTSLCQNDICIYTHFHRKTADITLVEGQLIYDLPNDCIAVNRLEYAGQVFPVESRMAIDDGQAVFPCALKDNLPFNQIEIVLNADGSDETLLHALEELYGVVTAMDTDGIDASACELEDDFGVVTDMNTNGFQDPAQNLGVLKVYYSAVPPIIQDRNEELVVPDIWYAAFLHYVTGTALQDDNDANNVERGELELQKYNRMLTEIYKKSAKDFTSNIRSKLTVPPRRI